MPTAPQRTSALLHPDPSLTQVEAHTHEDDEAKPGTENRGEVNDTDDNVRNGGDDAEDDVAGGQEGGWRISLARWGCLATRRPPQARSDLSRLLMLLVPRSTLRRTSPVRRPRCQRRDSPCRWAKSWTCTRRLVNCCTHTHRKVRRLLTKPVEPVGHHGAVIGTSASVTGSQLRKHSWERGIWDKPAPSATSNPGPALVAAPQKEQQW